MATAASDAASQDNSYQTVIAIVVAMVLVNVAVFLRLLARKLMKLPLMADDYMIMVAAVHSACQLPCAEMG